MKFRVFIFLLVLFFTLQGCAFIELFESSKIKRYKSATYEGENNDLIDVVLFGTQINAPKKEKEFPTLWTLDDRGQAAMIETFDKRYKDEKKFKKNLQGVYFKSETPTVKTDYTVQRLRLIFSVSKKQRYQHLNAKEGIGFTPADRIQYLKINLRLDDPSGIKFVKWNKFETEYHKLEIADVSFNKSFSLTGGVNASRDRTNTETFSPEGSSKVIATNFTPSVSANGAIVSNENQKLTYRYLSLHGKLTENEISFEQEGRRELDLAGNIIVEVDFKFPFEQETLTKFSALYDIKKKPQDINKVVLNTYDLKVPSNLGKTKDIFASLEYEYIYRHVKNDRASETFYEWDDSVEFYEGCKELPREKIFNRGDYVPLLSIIASKSAKLKLKPIHKNEYPIVFENGQEATAFKLWLVEYANSAQKSIEEFTKLRNKTTTSKKKSDELDEKINELKKPLIFGNKRLLFDTDPVTIEYIEQHKNSWRVEFLQT